LSQSKKETTAQDTLTIYSATDAEAAAFDLQPHLIRLMFDEPFYSKVLRGITKTQTDAIPTAGVAVRDGNVRMYWNPKFLASLAKDEGPKKIKGLLIHECLHLVFEHCTERKHEPHLIWNYATDCAINSLIPEDVLPECGIIPGRAPKPITKEKQAEIIKNHGQEAFDRQVRISEFIANLPKGLSSEQYFAMWMQQEDMKEAMKKADALKKLAQQLAEGGIGEMDEHGDWGEGLTDEEKELVKGKLKQAVEDAVKECDQKGSWGTVSSDTRTTLREMISKDVPWETILRRFCGFSRRANRSASRMRLNKKYPGIHSGFKRGYTASVAVYIDQSGSVGDRELELLFAELKNLASKVEFITYHFDTEVDEKSETVWRPGKTPVPHRTRCGGTCFTAPTEHANKNRSRFDGYIILTDGYAPEPVPTKLRRAWVITPHGQAPGWMDSNSDTVIAMKEPRRQAA